MVDDMGMAEEAIDDALVESAGYDDDNTGDENTIIQLVNQNKELEASLDEAEALARKNVELINGYLARIAELETQVDLLQNEVFELRKGKDSQKIISELMSQIAALQEIAIGKRTQEIYDEKFGHLTISIPAGVVEYWENLKIAQDEAIRQLSEEHPEAFR